MKHISLKGAGEWLFIFLVAVSVVALVAVHSAQAATPDLKYKVDNDWGSGFQAAVTSNPNAAAVTNWQLEFDYPGSSAVPSGCSRASP